MQPTSRIWTRCLVQDSYLLYFKLRYKMLWWVHSRETRYITYNKEIRQFWWVEVGVWFMCKLVFSFMSFLMWQLPKFYAEMRWKVMSSYWRISHFPTISLGKSYNRDIEVHATSFFYEYLYVVFLHFLPFSFSSFYSSPQEIKISWRAQLASKSLGFFVKLFPSSL